MLSRVVWDSQVIYNWLLFPLLQVCSYVSVKRYVFYRGVTILQEPGVKTKKKENGIVVLNRWRNVTEFVQTTKISRWEWDEY